MSVESDGLLLRQQQPAGVRQYAWVWNDILLPLLLTRLILTAIGFFTINTMPLSTSERFSASTVRQAWISTWARWDAIWYLQIARDGYSYTPGQQSSVAFFPLYPELTRAGGLLLGHGDKGLLLSGIIIANLALVIAMIYLWKLVRLDFNEATARRAILYALIAPTTLFLSAAYPMSLILAIAVAAFYHARVRQWWTAGLIAMLAPLARPDGILLVPGLLFEYLRQRDLNWRQIRSDITPVLLLPATALAGWMAFLQFRFGDALAFVHVQKAWAASPMWANLSDWDALFGLAAAFFTGALLFLGWFRLHSSYMLYASMHWLLMVNASRATSVPRYALVLFPVYIMLGLFGHNTRFDRVWTMVSMALATMLLLRFSLCYFVG